MTKKHFENVLATEFGFANRCKLTGEIHIGFGTSLLIFYPDNFPLFIAHMENNLRRRLKDKDCCRIKNIVIPSPVKEISLLLSLVELKLLVKLVNDVNAAIIVKELALKAAKGDDKSNYN